MRVNTKPRRQNSHRADAVKRCAPFLQWLRGRECVFGYMRDCGGNAEAMHLDFAGGKGIWTKVSDQFSVASCSVHHAAQHKKGWVTFLREVGHTKDGLIYAAEQYWRAWPGRIAWERKLEADNG